MPDDLKRLEEKIDSLHSELEETTKLVQSEHDKTQQWQKYHALETTTVSFLVAIAVSGFSYLITIKVINNEFDLLLFSFMLIATPAAFILLIFHAYSVYDVFKNQYKKIPFMLDSTLFIYTILAILTAFIAGYIYPIFNLSTNLLTLGWVVAASIIIVDMIIAGWISFGCISKKLTEKFPDIFEYPKTSKNQTKRILLKRKHKEIKQPKIKKIDALKSWENDPRFIKYDSIKKEK